MTVMSFSYKQEGVSSGKYKHTTTEQLLGSVVRITLALMSTNEEQDIKCVFVCFN